MSDNATKSLWMKAVSEIPSTMDIHGHITNEKANELLIASNGWEDEHTDDIIGGIHIFNAITNEWKVWMKYNDTSNIKKVKQQQIMHDKTRKILYLWNRNGSVFAARNLYKINLINKECTEINHDEEPYEQYAVNLRDEIHFIGGWNSSKHIKFNKNTQKFDQVYDFGLEDLSRMHGLTAVYIESKDVILIAGGEKNYPNDQGDLDFIREFSLKTGKWRKLSDCKYPYWYGHGVGPWMKTCVVDACD